VARGRPNHQKRAVRLVFEWCGWWWWPEEAPTPENERLCSFSGWCWQEEGSTLENERLCSSSRGVGVFEGCGCLRGVWVSSRGVGVFEGCGWLFVVVFRRCWQEEGPTPENEWSCSFSRGVGGGAAQRKVQPPKTSRCACFWGGGVGWWWWWLSEKLVVVARGRSNPENERLRSFSGVVGGW